MDIWASHSASLALESSFEEWKRDVRLVLEEQVLPLESSFEEWKPKNSKSPRYRKDSLESSFEEWKPGHDSTSQPHVVLLNLPLRNGNAQDIAAIQTGGGGS